MDIYGHTPAVNPTDEIRYMIPAEAETFYEKFYYYSMAWYEHGLRQNTSGIDRFQLDIHTKMLEKQTASLKDLKEEVDTIKHYRHIEKLTNSMDDLKISPVRPRSKKRKLNVIG